MPRSDLSFILKGNPTLKILMFSRCSKSNLSSFIGPCHALINCCRSWPLAGGNRTTSVDANERSARVLVMIWSFL